MTVATTGWAVGRQESDTRRCRPTPVAPRAVPLCLPARDST